MEKGLNYLSIHLSFFICVFVYLYVLLYPNQALLQSIKAGGIQHLFLNLGSVRTPGHQEQLLLLGGLTGSLALMGVLKIKNSVPGKVDILNNYAHR